MTESAAPFRFRIAEAFALTGRGTVVTGEIEQGVVSVGDRLHFVHGDAVREVVCRGIESPRVAGWTPGDPIPIALLVPELSKSEVDPGDLLVGDR